jgi:hypothetical protein
MHIYISWLYHQQLDTIRAGSQALQGQEFCIPSYAGEGRIAAGHAGLGGHRQQPHCRQYRQGQGKPKECCTRAERVAVSVADSANPYEMMLTREWVVEETAKGAVNALTRWQKSTFAVTSTSVSQAGRKADTPEDKARKRILPKAGKIILGRPGTALLKQAPESLLPYSGVDHVLCVAPAADRIYMRALFWPGVMTFSQRRPDALVEQMRHDALPSSAEPSALVYIAYIS